MSVPTLPANLTPDDYEAIESAVMETVRGRWFLMEFPRRNRTQEMTEIRETLARLERAMSRNLREAGSFAQEPPEAVREAQETVTLAEWARNPEPAPPTAPEPEPIAPPATLAALDALSTRDKIALFA